MRSKLKEVPRAAWFIAGVVITVVLVPTVAVATIAGNYIKGFPSNNRADVTASNQLLTSPAPLSHLTMGTADTGDGNGNPVIVLAPAAGKDDVVTSISVGTEQIPTGGSSHAIVFISGNSTCTGGPAFTPLFTDYESTVSSRSYSFPSGIAVPNGESLCANEVVGGDAEVDAWGYSVPAGTASG
jgi:hypothetical protein